MESYGGAEGIERAWRDAGVIIARALAYRAEPYLREIMNCLSLSSPVPRVALMKGAQIGGTVADAALRRPAGNG